MLSYFCIFFHVFAELSTWEGIELCLVFRKPLLRRRRSTFGERAQDVRVCWGFGISHTGVAFRRHRWGKKRNPEPSTTGLNEWKRRGQLCGPMSALGSTGDCRGGQCRVPEGSTGRFKQESWWVRRNGAQNPCPRLQEKLPVITLEKNPKPPGFYYRAGNF